MKTILLDMDGVLVDFASGALRLFRGEEDTKQLLANWPKGEYAIEKVLGVTTMELWFKINTEGARFWEHLKPYPWVNEVIEACVDGNGREGREVMFCTAPSLLATSYAGKANWAMSYIISVPGLCLILIPSKVKRLLAGPETILIDDSEQNCNEFEAAGGTAILFPAPWNRFGKFDADPGNYVRRALEGVMDEVKFTTG